jgi:hypothetical protein
MKFQLPDIPTSEQTPLVKGLLSIIEPLIEQNRQQKEEIDILKDEVRILKGQKNARSSNQVKWKKVLTSISLIQQSVKIRKTNLAIIKKT